jgi:MarR family transcriptional regulator, organic hydroperoxide resistance regulator
MQPFVDPCDFCATGTIEGLYSGQLIDLVTETKKVYRADMAKQTISMARPVRAGDGPSRKTANDLSNDAFRKLLWEITSINVHLDQIRAYWAQNLGISGPQWMILMAVSDLDRGHGVPVKDVSAALRVDPSFVTTQSKMLEKMSLLRRVPSREDARVVLMSLSEKARKHAASLSAKQELFSKFIFSEFNETSIKDLLGKLSLLENRLEKAALKLSADL